MPPAGISRAVEFAYRDREEELEGVARRLKADGARAVRLDRTALVVSRPLPYLYLARDVFAGAGVPFQALDTLPLAAEPYAAALDLVLEFVAASFTRRAMMALLRSPHFRFDGRRRRARSRGDVALDACVVEQRFLGGLDRLTALTGTLDRRRSARGAAAIVGANELAPLLESRPLADQVDSAPLAGTIAHRPLLDALARLRSSSTYEALRERSTSAAAAPGPP